MAAHSPPVPPDQRSDKAPENPATSTRPKDQTTEKTKDPKTDRYGAVKQNTTNKGYQQDR
ncbi:MAG TPA: hypothetical protein VLI93_08175 [Acetobacteraceae bacterium]|nr:hypothetical protein [Acetobacteraceae bacterium]